MCWDVIFRVRTGPWLFVFCLLSSYINSSKTVTVVSFSLFHLSKISSIWYQEPEHESGSSSLFVTVTIIVRRLPQLSAAVRRAVRRRRRRRRRVFSGEVRVRCASRSATHPRKSRPQKPPHAPPRSAFLRRPSSACTPRAAFPAPESRRATVVRLAGASWSYICSWFSVSVTISWT